MTTTHIFSDSNFQTEVIEHSRQQPVLVDFTAVWCSPCKMLDPVVEKLTVEWGGAVRVGKLDIDENIEMTETYGVMGVPTLILFRNGKPAERLMGYMPRERILAKLTPHLR